MTEPRCPACTAPGLQSARGGGFHCDYCGTDFHVQPVRCPVCGWENPRRSEVCANCGEPLTMVARVLTRQGTAGPPFWLGRVRNRAGVIKEQEALASQQRMDQLLDIDRRRQQDDARVLARQRATDWQVMLVIGVAAAVLGLVVLVLVVLGAQGG